MNVVAPPIQVTLSGVISVAVKPIMVIVPSSEMIGYLPMPLNEAAAALTDTIVPSFILHHPSN
jgi:hypothetical protein